MALPNITLRRFPWQPGLALPFLHPSLDFFARAAALDCRVYLSPSYSYSKVPELALCPRPHLLQRGGVLLGLLHFTASSAMHREGGVGGKGGGEVASSSSGDGGSGDWNGRRPSPPFHHTACCASKTSRNRTEGAAVGRLGMAARV